MVRLGLATLAAITLFLSAAGLLSLNTEGGHGLPLSPGHALGARRLLMEAGNDPAAVAAAGAQATRALRLSPMENSPRLMLAYIDFQQNGRLTSKGFQHIKTSYDLVAVDPDSAAWRVRFGLETWDALTPDVRDAVRREALALYRLRGRRTLKEITQGVTNPSGQVAAAQWSLLFPILYSSRSVWPEVQ
jgi:hypothetical protein